MLVKTRLASTLGRALPDKFFRFFWRAMIGNDRFMKLYGWEYMGEIARRSKVERIAIRGKYGLICSSPADAFILKEYAVSGSWAGPTNELIRQFFTNGQGTYLDIGANIGMTTIPLASTTEVQCYAFEPDPTNFANLQANIRENCPRTNVIAQQIALFDRATTLSFELSDRNLGDHRVRYGASKEELLNEGRRTVIHVPSSRLDDLNIHLTHPAFVKIDTQGAEPFIIAGGNRTLSQADVILMEWSPYMMRRMSANPRIAIDFIRQNFTTARFNVDPTSEAPLGMNFQPVSDICEELERSLVEYSGAQYADLIVRK